MSKAKYEEGFGVGRLKWTHGHPVEGRCWGLVLVEVWTSRLHMGEARKPQVGVCARIEVWCRPDTTWLRVMDNGTLGPVKGEARRWTLLPYRHWRGTVALAGWAP